MRTGVYGGTFNPIHRGHLHILGEFIRRLSLDRVLLVPAGTPPHKQAPDLAPAGHRAAMCQLAAGELPGQVEVTTMELERPGKSYTVDTLEALQDQYPEDRLFLLMGEDMFLTVDSWFRAKRIFGLATLCASPRSPEGLLRLKEKQGQLEALGACCAVEDIPFWDVSSTQVRELAGAGKDVRELVPDGVAEYMKKHRIYRGGGNNGV